MRSSDNARLFLLRLLEGIVAWHIVATSYAAEPLPAGAVLVDDDIISDLLERHAFVVAPGGDKIAYFSRGALWTSDLSGAPPKKLADLPGSLTSLISTPEFAEARARFNAIGTTDLPGKFYPRGRPPLEIGGLKWAPDGSGVYYLRTSRSTATPYRCTYSIQFASLKATVTTVATSIRDMYDEPQGFWEFDVPSNPQIVVFYAGFYPHSAWTQPLLWNSSTNRPIATCFDQLFAAPSCERFFGVEIDTRQLVLTNVHVEVAKRFEIEIAENRSLGSCYWSPDESHLVYSINLPHPDREAEWYRLDLKTGVTVSLAEGFSADQFVFTGNGDEVIRIGKCPIKVGGRADGGDGCYVTLVEKGGRYETFLARFEERTLSGTRSGQNKPYVMPVASPDCHIAAIALPRKDGKPGYRYWIADCDGDKSELLADEPSQYYSPFLVLAFVDGGKRLLAYDHTRLFTVPVTAPQKADTHE